MLERKSRGPIPVCQLHYAMDDTVKHIDIDGLSFGGLRKFFDEGRRGHIELSDYGTGEPVVRVVHPGAGLPLEIVGYGRSVPRFVIEWLFDTAERYLV